MTDGYGVKGRKRPHSEKITKKLIGHFWDIVVLFRKESGQPTGRRSCSSRNRSSSISKESSLFLSSVSLSLSPSHLTHLALLSQQQLSLAVAFPSRLDGSPLSFCLARLTLRDCHPRLVVLENFHFILFSCCVVRFSCSALRDTFDSMDRGLPAKHVLSAAGAEEKFNSNRRALLPCGMAITAL